MGILVSSPAFDRVKALAYLRSQFDPDVQLCHESPEKLEFQRTYWTMNDNCLAGQALQRLGDNAIAQAIRQKLKSIKLPFGHDASSNNGWADAFIDEQSIGHSPFRGTRCYRILSDGSLSKPLDCQGGLLGLMHEEADGGLMLDEENYFLLTASKTLSRHKDHDFINRDRIIRRIEQFWDMDNTGFRKKIDTPPASLKQTMNFAVYILLGEKCGWPVSFSPDIQARAEVMLNRLQLRNGGFATQYFIHNDEILWPRTDTFGNVETTSLCVMANIDPGRYYQI
jgi:hypothetical protein